MDQLARIDSDGRLVTVDHGDGYPRAFVLHKFRRDVANGSYGRKPNATILFELYGKFGENNTNASVGGFEISDSSYLVVGNSTYQTDFEKKTRNLLLSVTDKSTKTPRTIWLTDYKESEPGVETPHLVKLSNDRFMILWSEVGSSVVNYQIINGSGSTVGSTHQLNGYLSDCQPIVANNQVQWYTYNGYDLTFYGIDIDTLKSTTKRLGAEQKLTLNKQSLNFQLGNDGETLKPTVNPSLESGQNIVWKSSDQVVATVDGYGFVRPLGVGKTTITACIDNNPSCKAKCQVKVTGTLNNATIRLSKETYTYTGKALKPDVTVIVNGLTLTEGKDYKLQYDKNKNAGTAKVIVTGKGYYSGKKSKNFTIKKATQKFSVTAKAQTVKNVKKSKLTGVFTVKNNHGKVTYSKASGSGNFTVDKSGVITVKKGTKKGTYKIKVKCKAAGDGNYKAAEKTVTVKITVK